MWILQLDNIKDAFSVEKVTRNSTQRLPNITIGLQARAGAKESWYCLPLAKAMIENTRNSPSANWPHYILLVFEAQEIEYWYSP
jgi:hypothetical protein